VARHRKGGADGNIKLTAALFQECPEGNIGRKNSLESASVASGASRLLTGHPQAIKPRTGRIAHGHRALGAGFSRYLERRTVAISAQKKRDQPLEPLVGDLVLV